MSKYVGGPLDGLNVVGGNYEFDTVTYGSTIKFTYERNSDGDWVFVGREVL